MTERRRREGVVFLRPKWIAGCESGAPRDLTDQHSETELSEAPANPISANVNQPNN
jgi:hypothetical protein